LEGVGRFNFLSKKPQNLKLKILSLHPILEGCIEICAATLKTEVKPVL